MKTHIRNYNRTKVVESLLRNKYVIDWQSFPYAFSASNGSTTVAYCEGDLWITQEVTQP
jgi:hypothetical protein